MSRRAHNGACADSANDDGATSAAGRPTRWEFRLTSDSRAASKAPQGCHRVPALAAGLRLRPAMAALLGLLALAGPLTGAARAQHVQSGTYTGNATDNRAITGVGFQPDIIIVRIDDSKYAVIRTSTMNGDLSKDMAGATSPEANLIQSLDSDWFTVGTDDRVNKTAKVVHWIASKAGSHAIKVGSYTGNGSAGRVRRPRRQYGQRHHHREPDQRRTVRSRRLARRVGQRAQGRLRPQHVSVDAPGPGGVLRPQRQRPAGPAAHAARRGDA